jgi:hypothetical protein
MVERSQIFYKRMYLYVYTTVKHHVSIWNWIQKYTPQREYDQIKRKFWIIVDETLLKFGSEYIFRI